MACRSSETRARSYRMVVRGSAWLAASCTSRREASGVERRGDEGVAEGVRADSLGDP